MLDDVTDPVFEFADWVCAIQRDGMGTVRIGPSWRSRLVANRDGANAHQFRFGMKTTISVQLSMSV